MEQQPVSLPVPGEDQDELDAVVIRDNGEPLVDFIGMSPRLTMVSERAFSDWPLVHVVRQSVARMLVQAAEALPDGLGLCVMEGYRPLQVQRAMYERALERTRKNYPDMSEAQTALEAGRWSAPPDAVTPPPHSTGGAVDVAIAGADGQLLDFLSPYDWGDWRQALPFAEGLSETAKRNRALLRSVLEPTGLTNYVDEWWHWSYGDNGWALRVGAQCALYGRVELPDTVDWIGDVSKLPGA